MAQDAKAHAATASLSIKINRCECCMNYLQELFWYKDWGSLSLISVLFLLSLLTQWPAPLEQQLYATNMRALPTTPHQEIVLVTLDDESLAARGDLPWPRNDYAQLLQAVQSADLIGLVLPLDHSSPNTGLSELQAALNQFAPQQPLFTAPAASQAIQAALTQAIADTNSTKTRQALTAILEQYQQSVLNQQFASALRQLQQQLLALHDQLSGDQALISAVRQVRYVVTAMPALLTEQLPATLPSLSPDVLAQAVRPISEHFNTYLASAQPPLIGQLHPPFTALQHQSRRLAVLPVNPDDVARIPLITRYQNYYLPTLPLVLAHEWLAPEQPQIEVRLGQGVRFSEYRINTDPALHLYSRFYPSESWQTVSAVDVLSGRITTDFFIGKLVLIGITATTYQNAQMTPFGLQANLVVTASAVSSLIQQDFLVSPDWAWLAQVTVLCVLLAYVIVLLPRLRWPWALIATALLFVAGIGLESILFSQNITIPLLGLLLLLPVTYISLQLRRAVMAYQDAFLRHPDAVEGNRLLALAFQGQGQLDLAFEKFRLCPPDEMIMGQLYNLALDYEQQREYRRAAAVYRYMMQYNPTYRDLERRLERASQLRRPAGLRSNNALSKWVLDNGNDKPTLGRYQVERELGKGAMGTVFLGHDPKLDRLVAIKTLALGQEFEAKQLQEATTRFFREAEAAGRLKHPAIISIYDAGEEDELAYLCMEFFKGSNLIPYTQPDNLLPLAQLIPLVQMVADALDYAHSQGVVHRDIKPANILYNPASGQVKITDFGIARITDTHSTRTGVILGTPSYMSPEQLAGKCLDGRTDLFSLGIMFYQLLTGQLPFQADTMTALMYRITNDAPPALAQYRPELSVSLVAIVEQLLAKDPTQRFQTGKDLAAALSQCQYLDEEMACN